VRIPEGSQERDYKGRKLVAGRLGGAGYGGFVGGALEYYLSIVLKGRRYLYIVGYHKGHVWFRRRDWSLLNSLRGYYSPDVSYWPGGEGFVPGYYHRDETEEWHGPFTTREAAHAALIEYCKTL
jgi:hypothetical protein